MAERLFLFEACLKLSMPKLSGSRVKEECLSEKTNKLYRYNCNKRTCFSQSKLKMEKLFAIHSLNLKLEYKSLASQMTLV